MAMKDVIKFARNVYGYENMSGQNFEKQYGHHSQLFENLDALNLEIMLLASSNLCKKIYGWVS